MLVFFGRVTGHSMEPAFFENDRILVSTVPYFFCLPRKGDVVVFRNRENKKFVKRIINIQKGRYFLIGDNKKDSQDSKLFGWIERKDILGKVIAKF